MYSNSSKVFIGFSAARPLREFKLPGKEHKQVVLKTCGHTISVVSLVLFKHMRDSKARELLVEIHIHAAEEILVADVPNNGAVLLQAGNVLTLQYLFHVL
jgi:hypothetical protein